MRPFVVVVVVVVPSRLFRLRAKMTFFGNTTRNRMRESVIFTIQRHCHSPLPFTIGHWLQ
jgi:hypothetical protein